MEEREFPTNEEMQDHLLDMDIEQEENAKGCV